MKALLQRIDDLYGSFEIFNGILINGLAIKNKDSLIFSSDKIKLKLSLPALILET